MRLVLEIAVPPEEGIILVCAACEYGPEDAGYRLLNAFVIIDHICFMLSGDRAIVE